MKTFIKQDLCFEVLRLAILKLNVLQEIFSSVDILIFQMPCHTVVLNQLDVLSIVDQRTVLKSTIN